MLQEKEEEGIEHIIFGNRDYYMFTMQIKSEYVRKTIVPSLLNLYFCINQEPVRRQDPYNCRKQLAPATLGEKQDEGCTC